LQHGLDASAAGKLAQAASLCVCGGVGMNATAKPCEEVV
jgi:hypothetical protein